MKKSLHTLQQKKLQKLLREIRAESRLSQTDLAGRLGKPQSFVSKYETGERLLDIIELRQVCFAIGLSLQNFIRQLENVINETES